ncbi:Folylpolyglutamate synthase [Platanthera zijinensis]|uniref:Folylpolyglutamate synthase n=1 Tax=Platanthera zijinensis TaxID=2320716 RepID=A0AAP0BIP2_9ASPA
MISRFVTAFSTVGKGKGKSFMSSNFSQFRLNSTFTEDPKLQGFLDYMEKLKNYERIGVPKDAGTDSDDGFDLGRMRRLLQRLGNPHSHFKAVHVAGTKGKGSTAAFLSNILREEGYSVGCYTSPHLLTIRERISLGRNGGPVSVELLRNIFYHWKEILNQSIELEDGALTHFEVFTALAFSLFSQQGVAVAVIEAGLGGARDATNVLCSSRLAASVITSIGEEHLLALGGSLESIAMAKSGIIKHGRPVVIGGPLQPNIEHIIRNKASSLSCPVVSACDVGATSITRFVGRDEEIPYQSCEIHVKIEDMALVMDMFVDLRDVKLRMLGNHQLRNAVTATCAALCLRREGWRISDKSIQAGLEKTCLPGRGQFLTRREVETLGLSGVSILVDGAHTEASAKGLIDIIKLESPEGLLALVVSMASDKDHMAFATQVLTGRPPDVIIFTETNIAGGRSRTTSTSTLKDVWLRIATNLGIRTFDLENTSQQKHDRHVLLMESPNTLVGDSLQIADELLRTRSGEKPRLIVVTGSLHIVSSVLALLEMLHKKFKLSKALFGTVVAVEIVEVGVKWR